MENGTLVIAEILDCITDALLQIDEAFANNDINTATKKTHECMLLVKGYKDCLK